jgi:hypothetical protein
VAKTSGKPTASNTVHFACFNCRKAFKQRGSSNWDTQVPLRPFQCPDCKHPMARLDRYFKAPSQRASRQWLKVELLYHYGERFWSGRSGLNSKCRNLPLAVVYLAASGKPESEVRAVLESIRARRSGPASQGAVP